MNKSSAKTNIVSCLHSTSTDSTSLHFNNLHVESKKSPNSRIFIISFLPCGRWCASYKVPSIIFHWKLPALSIEQRNINFFLAQSCSTQSSQGVMSPLQSVWAHLPLILQASFPSLTSSALALAPLNFGSGSSLVVRALAHREKLQKAQMVPACIILLTAPLYGIVKRFQHLRQKTLCKREVLLFFLHKYLCLLFTIRNTEHIEQCFGSVFGFETCVAEQWFSSYITQYLNIALLFPTRIALHCRSFPFDI